MTTNLFAKTASFVDDGYSTLLGFADNPDAPVNYVMLNITNEPDGQDLSLGQGGVHIDAGALQLDGYDLIQDILVTDGGVLVRLTAEAAQQAEVDQDIQIELGSTVIDGVPLADAVARFKARLFP